MSLKSHAVEQRRATFLVELGFGAGDLLDLEAVTAIVEHDRIGDCLPALKIAFRQRWRFANMSVGHIGSLPIGDIMLKPLSEQLSDLSARAKKAEEAVASANKETFDKVRARRDQTRAAVEAAIEKIDQDIKSTGGTVSGKWNALKAKLTADKDAFKAAVAQRRHDVSVKRAEDDAELLEYEATCSVDYAIAAIEQAKLAVLDAVAGRIEAQGAKAS